MLTIRRPAHGSIGHIEPRKYKTNKHRIKILGISENKKLAVLIDADNATSSLIKELLAEIAKYGVASVKRAYGDWTTANLKGWKEHLHKHAIQPIQQFSYTSGKNSTDSSLIIEAMDLLHTKNFDGFCIISSDSDFTRLATRIRESGLTVYGFGEKKTPSAFVSACDKFIYTEILSSQRPLDKTPDNIVNVGDGIKVPDILVQAIKAKIRDDGWARLASVGVYISQNHPSFDARNFGFDKLGELVKSQKYIEVKEVNDSSGEHSHIHVRLKSNV